MRFASCVEPSTYSSGPSTHLGLNLNLASRLLSGLVCFAALANHNAFASSRDNEPSFRIIGYVSDAKKLPPVSARKLDVINFAFAKVNPRHEVFLPGETASNSLATLTGLRKDNPKLKVVLSIGGWGAGNFSEAAATASARKTFIDTSTALMLAHDLDGLDIDWEYPTQPGPGISHSPADRENFSLLLEELRARLDTLGRKPRRHYLLTIAAADGKAAQGLELARIAKVLDYINLMTYDFYGSLNRTTGHHAGLHASALAPAESRNATRAVDEFLAGGVPPRKIHLGLAFYGRRFGDVSPEHDGLYQPFASDGGYVTWQQIQRNFLDKGGFVRHWDEAAQSAWLWNAAERKLISYDDPQALKVKAAFVRERGLGGVMYWEQSTDPDEQLLDVVREALFAR